MLNLKKVFVATSLLASSTLTFAASDEDKGLQLAQLADQVDSGWVDQTVDITMTLQDRAGNQNIRKVRNEMLEVEDDGDKSLVVFDTPYDVKGTVMLSFSHKIGDDDQWLYLPALKRVKRISSSNKSGPFMGSDFAYEDMSSQEVEKYTYKFIREDEFEGQAVNVVERTPVYENSGYSKQLVWLDKKRTIPLQIEYFDRKGSALKTQHFKGYQLYNERFWRVDDLLMVNHQKGTQTTISFDNYNISQGVRLTNFAQANLSRIR
ncbi:outer membrane lipoprotein-sorting protein [Pseudoalteromonas piscicida]|uniref:outer membrane lipoprotein-sorting protein n=1 Tax=Pseudoalteromonas piscicida TaxID=43662 RepID=UPI0005FA9453|nr:outer membrane lipoprotein-sorting protein [Pseudoalteromonas piscicida]KJZ04745.1 membrane protein [Pseudoalteromonas piscicida]